MLASGIIVIILIFGIYLIKQSSKTNPEKILNVYAQKGKWYSLKYCFMVSLLFLRRLKCYIYGKNHVYKIEILDRLQQLSYHDQAFDAVFFHAVSQNGIYFCGGTERRQKGKIVGLVYIVHPDYGVLESEELPDTNLDASVISLYKQDRYSGGGICITPLKPMKKWKITYKGLMKQHLNPHNRFRVDLDLDWTSDYQWFFFEVDVPISVIARAIAREEWSPKLFQNLKDAHQKHYEQMGYVNGTLQIDAVSFPFVNVDAFRDHSFGFKRDWSLMHRYIYSMFYLTDKTKIALGVVSQPCTTSHLEMGFVNHVNGKLDPIDNIDLFLPEHAENGVLPKVLNFTFDAQGVSYDVRMEFLYDTVHYKGSDREAVMNERFHKCIINGVPGRGISEWHYNKNILGVDDEKI
ncbi:uncharacterized protein LOC130446813 [Diorhabda sublineata]|uniref:uncharacterized protein LOC130446813 n=1 Tax=Diorhabda sublineata TaxID=1163346 RepID=UPI0024E0B18F|nr:uncharacterized protein LOC130446813 [Diorhabda sublineata]XP_056639264.1 uncharacterized protein LOC130446813 [Diorhabda sublineata]XP_056639265.1 uncharacterized protein LOC130446813 [Diorhabda sublineata]